MKRKLTRAEKRVAIAKDVLKHLATTKATPGVYVDGAILNPGTENDSASKHIAQLSKCRVCALGACLIARVRKFDGLTIRQLWLFVSGPYYGLFGNSALADIFTTAQMRLIEDYFEGSADGFSHAFLLVNKSPKRRLRLIMQNIIANGGTFRPQQLLAAT